VEKGIGEVVEGYGEVGEVGVGVGVGERAVVAGGFLGVVDGAFEVFDLGLPGRKIVDTGSLYSLNRSFEG